MERHHLIERLEEFRQATWDAQEEGNMLAYYALRQTRDLIDKLVIYGLLPTAQMAELQALVDAYDEGAMAKGGVAISQAQAEEQFRHAAESEVVRLMTKKLLEAEKLMKAKIDEERIKTEQALIEVQQLKNERDRLRQSVQTLNSLLNEARNSMSKLGGRLVPEGMVIEYSPATGEYTIRPDDRRPSMGTIGGALAGGTNALRDWVATNQAHMIGQKPR